MPDHAGRLRFYADMREEMGRLVGNDLAGHLRAAADHVVALEAERDRLAAEAEHLRRAALEAVRWSIACPEDAEHVLAGLLYEIGSPGPDEPIGAAGSTDTGGE